jgi:hypothetical protein
VYNIKQLVQMGGHGNGNDKQQEWAADNNGKCSSAGLKKHSLDFYYNAFHRLPNLFYPNQVQGRQTPLSTPVQIW